MTVGGMGFIPERLLMMMMISVCYYGIIFFNSFKNANVEKQRIKMLTYRIRYGT